MTDQAETTVLIAKVASTLTALALALTLLVPAAFVVKTHINETTPSASSAAPFTLLMR